MRVSGFTYLMSNFLHLVFFGVTFCGVLPVLSHGQTSKEAVQGAAASSAQRGISLAEKGDCSEALPVLKRIAAHIADAQLKYHAAMALARCAMSLGQTEVAVNALLLLNREFPRDPEVLYVTTRYYSELASRASQQLVATAPSSYQVRELDAEALESQGKWDKATAEYRKILEQNPKLPQIHYRVGRILLAKPATPTTAEDAEKEFREELKIDPNNASAEFMLGELARQAGNWDVAIRHFSRATKLDEGFSEAYLALGMSLSSAGRFSDAIPSLEKYTNMEASDPAGHYQLAIAYSRTGDKQKAQREMALQAETEKRNPQATPDSAPSH